MIRGADEAMKTGSPRSEGGLKIMFAALQQYSLDQIIAAVTHHVATQNYPIRPADITAAIEGKSEDKSAIAWRIFLDAIHKCGYYDSVRFQAPAFHYVIEQLGGWERASEAYMNMTDKELGYREKSWRELFEVGMKVATWDNVRAWLPGNIERENRERGYHQHIPAVREIGTGKQITQAALSAPRRADGHALPIPKIKEVTA